MAKIMALHIRRTVKGAYRTANTLSIPVLAYDQMQGVSRFCGQLKALLPLPDINSAI
jgi:hypothetical protein